MGTIELKSNIHKIVDEIQSEQLLQTLYDFLKMKETNKSGQLGDSLSDIKKKEVLLAFDESERDENLSDMNSLFKKSE